MRIKKLHKARFDALCYSRQPLAHAVSQEVEWYADQNENVLGIVCLDLVDSDWLWIILGRDKNGLFRAIKLDASISTRDKARKDLRRELLKQSKNGESVFIQGDERKQKIELFNLVVKDNKLNPILRLIKHGDGHSPARGIMQEIANAFVDIDGNYVKDFQTTGFNARLWELYLFAFLYEQRFAFLREFNRPDFCVSKAGFSVAIEAVTVNQTEGETASKPSSDENLKQLREDYMPIKFGSALFSKMKKNYWKLPHMKGIPFVIAIHDFHSDDSMVWSAPALEEYLYGTRATWWKDESGKLHIVEKPLTEHRWKNKKIPSGFFNLPDSENVSAILFSNSATISKFNRIGKLAEFGNPDVAMLRIGAIHNPDPNATKPIPFCIEVEPKKYDELWSEGVRILHNPKALNPIPKELFPYCSHHYFENGRRVALLPKKFIYESKTMILTPKNDTKNGR